MFNRSLVISKSINFAAYLSKWPNKNKSLARAREVGWLNPLLGWQLGWLNPLDAFLILFFENMATINLSIGRDLIYPYTPKSQ